MVDVTFKESQFRFIDPIRKFKANDPYYYEVDNIPIIQLEENIKFLKDQLAGFDIKSLNVSRPDFTELRLMLVDANGDNVPAEPEIYKSLKVLPKLLSPPEEIFKAQGTAQTG